MFPQTTIPRFSPTRWSLLGRLKGPEPEARKAIEELCTIYWRPLYCYARQRRHSQADAKDATQGFLMHALKHNLFGRADQDRGKLRSLLLTAFSQWMLNERARDKSIVHGGEYEFVSPDALTVAEWYYAELSDKKTPEDVFVRSWALTLLDRVLERLQEKWNGDGKAEWFATLKPFLSGGRSGDETYAEAGRRLNVSAERVRVAAHRLRRSYREELLREIRQTVESDDPAELEEELNFLIRAVS